MERSLGAERGKIPALSALVDEYTSELEYDLWTHCNKTDLLDLWRGGTRLTYRRLQVLIDGLPPESLTKTAIRDNLTPEQRAEIDKAPRDVNKHGTWSHVGMLLANVVDELRNLYWLLHAVNTEKKYQMKQPEPMPRPGVTSRKGSLVVVQRRVQQVKSLAEHRGRPPKEAK